jgi:predicted transporter
MKLFEKKGEFSKTAFWFSCTMALTLTSIAAIVIKYILDPTPEFISGLPGMAGLLAVPNSILAGAYTWGKKIDRQT